MPPRTLNEAGSLSVCYSKAWNSKIVTSAYWVKANQVSKTAPSGEYLTTGSFMIRGTKNYLPPSNLQMGLALLFRVADESLVNHINERKPKLLSQEEEDREAIAHDKLMKRMETKPERAPEGSAATQPSAQQSSADQEEPDSGEEVVDDTLSNDDGAAVLTQSEEQNNTNEDRDDNKDGDEASEESDEATDASKEALMAQIKQHPPTKEDIDGGDESDDEESFDASDEDEAREDLLNSSSSKYSISLVRDEPEERDGTESGQATDARKKKLSAHERRQMKRQQQGKPASDQPRPPKAQAKKDKQKPLTRGQKNKMKLIKKKYGEQDEEEREAMMKLLQPAGPAKVEEVVESAKPKESKKEVEQQNIEDIKKRTEKRLTTAQKRLAKEREEEEIRMLLKEEKLELLSDADKKKLEEIEAKGLGVNLAALTGMVRVPC